MGVHIRSANRSNVLNTAAILAGTFFLSAVALFVFIWSLRRGGSMSRPDGGRVIFEEGEIGTIEEPSTDAVGRKALQALSDQGPIEYREEDRSADLRDRRIADRSTRLPVQVLFGSAVVWLLVGSVAGLVSSIKLHEPDWLTSSAWMTFGRLRTVHLNAVAYGWTALGLLGLVMWLLPRLLRTPLRGGAFPVAGAVLWNIGLTLGLASILVGISDGMEWLEIPWQVGGLFAIGGGLIAIPLVLMLVRKRVGHLYVSVWYFGAALFWFPVLYLTAKIPGLHTGVEQATMNWWYGHNVLGYFFTPMALGCIYYFLPKVIGRPVVSYDLSLLGFWTLAFFYGQVGGHHLIGGPIPVWLQTLSIVQSVMMVIPVLAFTVNQHSTMRGHFKALKHSPTLRFILFGGMMYTLVSLQGSAEALRTVNNVTHFTHFTVAHAHLGMYAFIALVVFGSAYFAMPRVFEVEWPKPKLINVHFGLVVGGFGIYFISLTIGGWLQGLALLDAARPFMESVTLTLPFLKLRSLGGTLMTVGHFVFAYHFAAMAWVATRSARVSAPSLTVPAREVLPS